MRMDPNNPPWEEIHRVMGTARLSDGKRISKRHYVLQYKYGIGIREYKAMVRKQAGLCPVCLLHLPSGDSNPVDHNHATGKIRGVLHLRCNLLLGQADDNPQLLRNAAKYLEDSKGT